MNASFRGVAVAIGALAMLLLAGCAETEFAAAIVKDISPDQPVGTYKVGNPYQINGVWYYPAEDPYYDEEGIASWYGDPFHGRQTANGEIYDMNDLTAAHKTLPMPVYVRVTNLENGRSLVLRVNDRGPFVSGRIIDVSRRAAQLLGFQQQGTTRVRVQVVDPDTGIEYAAQDPNAPADTTPDQAEVALTGTETLGGIFVQAGAFGDANNAQKVSDSLVAVGAVQIYRVVVGDVPLYRVRLGPYATVVEAEAARTMAASRGYPEAVVVIDE
jgi:rare lipoprotein A